MKFLLIAVLSLTFLAAPAHAGAVDDSIDCVAKGKVSCGIRSLNEEVKVENISFQPGEETKATDQKAKAEDVEI